MWIIEKIKALASFVWKKILLKVLLWIIEELEALAINVRKAFLACMEPFLGLLILAAIVCPILMLIYNPEREGYVKYEDCREIVTLKSDTLQKYYKGFICSGRKSKSGKTLGGECVHITYGSGNVCERADIYQKVQELNCADSKFPYAGYDDMCHSTPQ